MKIAFIGLGNMGAPMARNLANAGHDLLGFDLAQTETENVKMASSLSNAAQGADFVITMLPNARAVENVVSEIYPILGSHCQHIDCSTIDVSTARRVADQAKDNDILALDAPVSGGVGGAAAGSLTFMVGGTNDAYENARPLLEIMGSNIVHCGLNGAGQAAKICNNMVLASTMIATCEAFALADKLGLDRQKMFDVVSNSSGYSWSLNAYCPSPGIGPQSPADNDYQPGFSASLMLKDLRLSQHAANDVGGKTPMGKHSEEIYQKFVNSGFGEKDFSAIMKVFEEE